MAVIAKAAGISGMVAGQVMDVTLEGKAVSQEALSYIHAHKTGDMITAALLSGIEFTSPSDAERAAITDYGTNIGLAFQIVDDVLDVTAGAEFGKTPGKDVERGKNTYASLYGVEGAMERAVVCTKKSAACTFALRAQGRTFEGISGIHVGA